MARGLNVVNAACSKAQPLQDQEMMSFWLPEQKIGVDHLSAEERQRTVLRVHRNICQLSKSEGIDFRDEDSKWGMAPMDSSRQDDVITLLTFLEQVRDQTGRILKITIHHDGIVSLSMGETCCDGDLLAIISAEANSDESVVCQSEFLDR